jgi:hypothetical protein
MPSSSSSSWDPALCGSSSVLLAKASPLHVRHRAEIEVQNRHAHGMAFVSKMKGKGSVPDPCHIGVDPDPPIHASD